MVERILTKIRTERIKKGFSQQYVASLLDISQSSYNKLENGNTELTVILLFEISQILDIDIHELLNSTSTLIKLI